MRREMQRFFVVCDYSPFRPDWRFFACRGMREAAQIAHNWVFEHSCGKATVVDVPSFRKTWYAAWRTCQNMSSREDWDLYAATLAGYE